MLEELVHQCHVDAVTGQPVTVVVRHHAQVHPPSREVGRHQCQRPPLTVVGGQAASARLGFEGRLTDTRLMRLTSKFTASVGPLDTPPVRKYASSCSSQAEMARPSRSSSGTPGAAQAW